MIPGVVMQLEQLPMTANGKLDRKALPEPEQPGGGATYAPPRNELEQALCTIWEQVLGVRQVGIRDNFFELGGDSIMSIQVVARAGQSGYKLTAKLMFQHQTIEELADWVEHTAPVRAEQGIVTGEVPLTPIQRWFLQQPMHARHHWNQAVLLTLRQPVRKELLEAAIDRLIRHHDALRLRYGQDGTGWRQRGVEPSAGPSLASYDWSDLLPEEQQRRMAACIDQMHASLDLQEGPLLRAGLFYLGAEEPARLLITIHHLVVDGVSWRILLDDLQSAYAQLMAGQPLQLPMKTTSYKEWAERLQQLAASGALNAEREYWQQVCRSSVDSLPVDEPTDSKLLDAVNTNGAARSIRLALDETETRELIQQVPAVTGAHMNDILLSPLLLALEQWTGKAEVSLLLEGHGREELFPDVDLSRTVGWFTSMYPVRLGLAGSRDPLQVMGQIGEQLGQVPQRGIGYGLLRYSSSGSWAALKAEPQISFNYLGQLKLEGAAAAYFGSAPEQVGSLSAPDNVRNVWLEVSGVITDGQLHMDWRYCPSIHRAATVMRLAEAYMTILRSILDACRGSEALHEAAAAVSEFGWNADELEHIMDALEDMDGLAEEDLDEMDEDA
ncbi:condensation domain-containing protein [Paenibacillus sp. SYP-B4298]|uniref:condensation domain-containing protein n=1 Tax=Paenibacillus sp. SYP-B4298 TaxID=2996034 RepID=UPI003FA7D57C